MRNLDVGQNRTEQTPPTPTLQGVRLGMSQKMSLIMLAVMAMSLPGKEAVAEKMSDTKAAVDHALMCVPLAPPGKLQDSYIAKIASIELPLAPDIDFLKASKLSSIRYNPRLFYPKKDHESAEEEVLSLKDETARRLRAYTTQHDNWFTLDFKKMGSDKKTHLPHESNIQLGDILLDLDIQTLLIQRADETVVKVTRGVCAEGGYKDRVGFLDEKGQFVPVFSGDRFRILSDKDSLVQGTEDTLESYLEDLNYEDKQRAVHKRSYQTQRGSAAVFSGKEDALKAAKKISYNPNDVKIPTLQMIEEAKRECRKDPSGNAVKNYYLAIGKENFMEIVKYCAAEVGVPVELILTTMRRESGFVLGIVGDHGKAVGLGQLHEPIFKFVRSKPKFAEVMGHFTDKPVDKIRRSESVLVDVLSVALVIRGDINANNIEANYQTRLTPRQMAYMRFHYHVPGTFAKHKENGFNKRKAGYFRYAEEALKVRQILDELAGIEPPIT